MSCPIRTETVQSPVFFGAPHQRPQGLRKRNSLFLNDMERLPFPAWLLLQDNGKRGHDAPRP